MGLLRGLARPAFPVIVDFIREHADHREPGGLRWGVEPICAVLTEHGLQVAPSTSTTTWTRRRLHARSVMRTCWVRSAGSMPTTAACTGPASVASPQPRGHRGRPLHRGAAHEGRRFGRGGAREDQAHHHRGPRRRSGPGTWSTATSPLLRRTGSGSRTSRNGSAG